MRKNGYTADIHVISNGINDDFIEAGKDRSFVAENPTDRLIKIMMIGRLSREKRQDLIINAMQYSKYANRIQLVFAGKGPRYQFLRQLGDKLMIKPQFLYLNRQQLIDELMTTDLYIHASDMESEAISCIEAFATGLVPVIANSPKSATPQFALDGRSLFKAGNAKDLARSIDYWLDRPQERAMMANKYRTSARKYSLSNSVAIFESMLRKEIGIDESQMLRRKIA